MSDTAKTPEPPSTIVECIPAVRLETGELLTTADEHAAHAEKLAAARAAAQAAAADVTVTAAEITEDESND